MFDSAKDIMQWLSLCAQVVAKADKPVHWTTPLGLPVVQPYRKKVCPALPGTLKAYTCLTQHTTVHIAVGISVMLPQH